MPISRREPTSDWPLKRSVLRQPAPIVVCALSLWLVGALWCPAPAQAQADTGDAAQVLEPEKWREIDASVARALNWLASRQQPDGAFPTLEVGQPGVTSLCVLAFLSHGHVAGEGEYGAVLERAIRYTLDAQQPNGWIGRRTPPGSPITRAVSDDVGGAAVYNHAISGLMLAEVYATGAGSQQERIELAIERALRVTLDEQRLNKRRPVDCGGWRYLHTNYPSYISYDSDLSITSWHLKFLRAAKNAGFDVPQQPIDGAVEYVKRCFNRDYGVFLYAVSDSNLQSRGMAGAGVLALAMGGLHDSPEAQQSGDWILKHDFRRYNQVWPFPGRTYPVDRYHYGVFHCAQAMYQLGGRHWEEFFPPTVETLLANQNRDGSWDAEGHPNEARFGNAYTTALVVMALGAANQVLPVYQR